MKKEIRRLLKGATLEVADYGRDNEYYRADLAKLNANIERVKTQLKKPLNVKRFALSAQRLWAGRLEVRADGTLFYCAGQYYPLEVANCLADVLDDANKIS